MRTIKRCVVLIVSLAMALSMMSACQTAMPAATTAPTVEPTVPATAAATVAATATTAPTPAPTQDPFGKFDPPITLTYVLGTVNYTFDNGDTQESNFWTKGMAQDLGINLQLLWVVPTDQYQEKWEVTMASGDLPDIIPYSNTDRDVLMKAGKLADLTDAYNEYASPQVKDFWTRDGGTTNQMCSVDGKLMGFTPFPISKIQDPNFLWVRTDWLQKLNLPEPTSMQNLVTIAQAFATQDPDGDGKADTTGLGLEKDLFASWAWLLGDAEPIFNGYHSNPTIWLKDSTGQLVYGGIQPEAKAALQELQNMYKSGAIDKQFGVKDSNKILEEVTDGTIGMFFAPDWAPEYPNVFSVQKNPNAVWRCYMVPSADSQPAGVTDGTQNLTQFTGFNASTPHPEALVKMLNWFVSKAYYSAPDVTKVTTDEKFACPITLDPPDYDYWAYKDVSGAMQSGDTSKLTGDELQKYQAVQAYLKSKDLTSGYQNYYENTINPDGHPGPFDYVDTVLVPQHLLIFNVFTGSPTPTMITNMDTLNKMQKQAYTDIILGANISEFDTFVANWKAAGGNKITQEVNDWAASNASSGS